MSSDNDFKLLNEFQSFYKRYSNIDIQNKEELIKRVNDTLVKNSNNKFLFIFDNCEQTTNIKDYLVNMPTNAKVLVTTNKEIDLLKNDSGFKDRLHLITIDPFDQEETREFIRNSIGENIEMHEIQILCDLIFDYFKKELRPYILTKLVGIIKLVIEDIFGSFGLFLEQYNNNRNEMIDDLMKEDKLFELLQQYHENVLNILYYSSYMDPDFIPGNMFTEILKLESKVISTGVTELKSKLLISQEQKEKIKGIKIHRSFQEEIKMYLDRKQLNQYKNLLRENMENTLFKFNTRDKLKEKNISSNYHYYNFKKVVENILESAKNEEKSLILFLLANCNQNYEEFEVALENYKESLRIKRLIFGSDEHSDIADALNNIAIVYNRQGKYDLALENYNESLRIYRLIFGSDEHLDIANTLNNIAAVYNSQGKYDLALENYNESLRILRFVFTNLNEHPSIVETLSLIEKVKHKKE
jgi:tetratricopeptide (TPR) repeat protein